MLIGISFNNIMGIFFGGFGAGIILAFLLMIWVEAKFEGNDKHDNKY